MSLEIPSLQVLGLADAAENADTPASRAGIRAVTYVADHTLFSVGDPRKEAYLIDSGEVRLLSADGELLCILGPGEIFGEMALVDRGARTATAVTTTLTDLFLIPRTALQERIRGLDPILSFLIGLLVERYRASRIQMPESLHLDLPDADGSGVSNIRAQNMGVLKELKLEQELRAGLERNEFIPFLQPIMKLPERQIIGFEALIRWNHPEKGMVFPDTFIPVAERTGVIQVIDRMMMQRACAVIPSLLKEVAGKVPDFFISVNLSGINFETLDVIQGVREALIESGVEPHHLKLEITESALIADPERAEQVLHSLRALGVTIALDDFGTGYSSLGYLHKFPIDSLKIDRSFISQIERDSKGIDIVSAIIGLTKNFKLGVVAEGIETEKDVQILNDLGCDMGQGYIFGKPMSINDAHEFIRKNLGT